MPDNLNKAIQPIREILCEIDDTYAMALEILPAAKAPCYSTPPR